MPRKKATRKKATRTPEAPKQPAAINPVPASRCRKCQSTRRTEYSNTRRREIDGVEPGTHKPFSAVVWRNCKCLDCGQARVDRTYEYTPEPAE